MSELKKPSVDRRGFLKGAAAGAALAAQAPLAAAQQNRGGAPVAAKPEPENAPAASKAEVLTRPKIRSAVAKLPAPYRGCLEGKFIRLR